ncbi:hypothetical protein F5X96DRAFT_627622 [Biscogniauxia mediterranea]|nr:hypothetical protein F5X96DRAFT_627622 [Biscogniauxia mediterranea]
MFSARRHVRNVFTPLLVHQRCPLPSTRRTAIIAKVLEEELKPVGALAENLAATGLWKSSRKSGAETRRASRSKTKSKTDVKAPKAEKARVNIVSEELCDDIIKYIGPSLNRHQGCDIIDLYPGAGLWSKKLNDYLQPRSHILLEPDAEFYQPFLQPLLDRPGTTVIPKSGIVWKELYSILNPEHLPNQRIRDESEPQQRNDTLLVTANLVFHPKKSYRTFDSIAPLILHQFVDSIRTSTLFQRYGLVRMLVWTRCEEKSALLPKSSQRRRRGGLEAELACEWVHEVVGRDGPDSGWFTRETALDTRVLTDVIKNMKANKIKMPATRQSNAYKEGTKILKSKVKIAEPGTQPPTFIRDFQTQLADLREINDKAEFEKGSDDYTIMNHYKWRETWENKKHDRLFGLWKGLQDISKAQKSGAPAEKVKELEDNWTAMAKSYSKGFMDEFLGYRDNLHLWGQSPSVLHWDRRQYEPMVMKPEEFFPNVECALMDIQPKPVHPLLRQTGPQSNRAADVFDLIVSSLLRQATMPLQKSLDGIWPGAADYILPRFSSLRVDAPGGLVDTLPTLPPTPRQLNPRQWEQLLELWMEWPFKPEFHELVSRTSDDMENKYEESALPGTSSTGGVAGYE